MRYVIENEWIRCEVDSHGAELKSLVRKEDGREILWGADPAYWNRTSPVLFPFVGAVKNKTYRHEGKEYVIGQHGFARDMEFALDEQEKDRLWFSLTDSKESLEKYPFRFRLKIGYLLEKSSVKVTWVVENCGREKMWFSIGAHPGFAIPKLSGHMFLMYDRNGNPVTKIQNRIFGQGGCVTDRTEEIPAPNGKLIISEELFENDALVLENGQIGKVVLADDKGNALVTMEFDAPLLGLWSPPHKNAPFVCMEPWYGRCDSESFAGELKDRDYEQKLEAGESFNADYVITVS